MEFMVGFLIGALAMAFSFLCLSKEPSDTTDQEVSNDTPVPCKHNALWHATIGTEKVKICLHCGENFNSIPIKGGSKDKR